MTGRFLTLASILLLGCASCSTSRTEIYRIAFVPSRSGQHGIFVMNSDDTGGKLLTADPNAILRPSSWSPDGSKIAFLSVRPADADIMNKPHLPGEYPLYVMDSGGNSQRRLLNCPVSSFVWSPDSSSLLFVSSYENPELDNPDIQAGKKSAASGIYMIDLRGREPTRVTSLGNNCFADWSPDGNSLVLSSGGVTESDIFVVGVDGKNARRLTDSSNPNIHPAWSPEGRTIAYLSLPSVGSPEQQVGVYLVDVDGANRRRIADILAYKVEWSRDGKRLLIMSAAGIYLATADAWKPVKINAGTDRPLDAAFTPDGKSIMFRSHDEGEWQLYTISLEGGTRRRITSRMSAASYCLSPLQSRN